MQLGADIAFIPDPLFPRQVKQFVEVKLQVKHLFAHNKQVYPER